MKTFIYMVRHGESPKTEGNERTRGLTDKGWSDSRVITELLIDEGIDKFVSSPYRRAILTIEELAKSLGKDILIDDDLKEVTFCSDDKIMPNAELYPLVKRMFSNTDFSLPDGESIKNCQNRCISALKRILKEYKGQRIIIGTHGLVMTLMMAHFDSQYNLEFLLNTSKPDIYRMEFHEEVLIETKRMWKG